jgi:cytidylate kinase
MTEKVLIPSIEKNLGSLIEFQRRKEREASHHGSSKRMKPTITISREFGCEAFPMAEHLKELLEKRTGEQWLLMERKLLEEVARNHNLSENILQGLGEKSRFLDEILATFSPRWKSEKDYFRLLCRHIVALANLGNVILMGRGSAFITRPMKNCSHFRLYASAEFKARSVSHRLDITAEEAEKLIAREQKLRDRFIRDFLDRDANDLSVYNLAINNDRNSAEKSALTIAEYVLDA